MATEDLKRWSKCELVSPEGRFCQLLIAHQEREQPLCRNSMHTWCSLCDRFGCICPTAIAAAGEPVDA